MLPTTRLAYGEFKLSDIQPGTKFSAQIHYDDRYPEQAVIPINVIKGMEEGPTLIVMAAVHGDEYEGVRALIELFRTMQPVDLRGTLITLPIANYSSYLNETRTTGADGKNLAREFPGDPEGTLTQRLAYVLDGWIAQADFLLDLHSGGTHYAMPLFVGYYENAETEIGPRSKAAAEAFGVHAIWGHDTPFEIMSTMGRSVSAATAHHVPWLYVEGYGGRRILEDEYRYYYGGTIRLLNHLGMIVDSGKWITEEAPAITHRLIGDGDLDKALNAEYDGLFVPSVNLLDRVESGQVIGTIYSYTGSQLQVIHAHMDGCVMMLRGIPYTKKGDGLYALARSE